VTQVVEHLPSKLVILSSNPSTTKKKKKSHRYRFDHTGLIPNTENKNKQKFTQGKLGMIAHTIIPALGRLADRVQGQPGLHSETMYQINKQKTKRK
jgi:hypothetical protein